MLSRWAVHEFIQSPGRQCTQRDRVCVETCSCVKDTNVSVFVSCDDEFLGGMFNQTIHLCQFPRF